MASSPQPQPERALLIGFERKSRHSPDATEESLAELFELATSAGASVQGSLQQVREAPDAATLVGPGKVQEIAALVHSQAIDVVLFDNDLSPTQQRNLEKDLDTKVIDRTQLILDIFAGRARTREGRLQVELAQLNYLLPRLSGKGVSMSRLGGGIGTRGPGETKLETDRRRIARRIRKVEQDLERVRAGRSVHRTQRRSIPLPTLALIGYTNAGKSTLFNLLTHADVLADAKMFATLDPTVRALTLPSRRRVLMSDTVGFIRNLPTTLVKAFRATLEEVADAALILHVVDASSPNAGDHVEHVSKVLVEIGAEATPQILVLNKSDALSAEPGPESLGERLSARSGTKLGLWSILISAKTGSGLEDLLATVDERLDFDGIVAATFDMPLQEGRDIALVHEFGRVRSVRYCDDHCEIDAEVPQSLLRRLARHSRPLAT